MKKVLRYWLYLLDNERAYQVVLMVKSTASNAGDERDMGSIPGSRRSPGDQGMAIHFSILA